MTAAATKAVAAMPIAHRGSSAGRGSTEARADGISSGWGAKPSRTSSSPSSKVSCGPRLNMASPLRRLATKRPPSESSQGRRARPEIPASGYPPVERDQHSEGGAKAVDQVQQRSGAGAASEVIGRRVGAGLLDIALLAVLFVVMGLLFGESHAEGGHASVNLHGAAAVVYFVLALGYYFVSEALSGATLGKRALGLRVIGPDGAPAGAGRVGVRTLVRIIDVLPLLYLVGFIAVLATPSKRRLGDLAAKTDVVAADRV